MTVVMYYTPGHFFEKSDTGCLVHHYSYPSAQFVENNTLDQFVENYTLDQFVENYTLDQFVENYTLDQFWYGSRLLYHYMEYGSNLLEWGTRAFFPHTDFITWCEQAPSAAQACKE